MTTATAIANHLNIVESAIAQVEEWASVLFVRFVKGSPRFVSKKLKEKPMKMTKEKAQELAQMLNGKDITIQGRKLTFSKQNRYSAVYYGKKGRKYTVITTHMTVRENESLPVFSVIAPNARVFADFTLVNGDVVELFK